jgi:hypothetical protein
MAYTFELDDGEEYKFEGNPTLRTVRKVQSMQTNLLLDYIDEEDLRSMDNLEDESAIVDAIIDNGGMEAFEEVQWRRSMLDARQAISLAADEVFDSETFDKMSAEDFMEVRERAEESLGGGAQDFFAELGVGMSLSAEEMDRMQSA